MLDVHRLPASCLLAKAHVCLDTTATTYSKTERRQPTTDDRTPTTDDRAPTTGLRSERAAIAEAVTRPGSVVLFPDGEDPSALAAPPRQIVILDASWPQARRMRQRIPALRGLPAMRLPAPTHVPDRLRRSRYPEHMSTAESVAAALEVVGEPAAAAHLRELLAELIRRSRLPGRHRHRRS